MKQFQLHGAYGAMHEFPLPNGLGGEGGGVETS